MGCSPAAVKKERCRLWWSRELAGSGGAGVQQLGEECADVGGERDAPTVVIRGAPMLEEHGCGD